MAGGSHMQASFNSIKLENPAYYCNSYTPPGPVDHHGMPLTSGYSEWLYKINLTSFSNMAATLVASFLIDLDLEDRLRT